MCARVPLASPTHLHACAHVVKAPVLVFFFVMSRIVGNVISLGKLDVLTLPMVSLSLSLLPRFDVPVCLVVCGVSVYALRACWFTPGTHSI